MARSQSIDSKASEHPITRIENISVDNEVARNATPSSNILNHIEDAVKRLLCFVDLFQ